MLLIDLSQRRKAVPEQLCIGTIGLAAVCELLPKGTSCCLYCDLLQFLDSVRHAAVLESPVSI